MNFAGSKDVTVNFATQNLQLTTTTDSGATATTYKISMQIGYIDESFRSEDYGIYYTENMFGLAAMGSTSDSYISRQFLYQLTQAIGSTYSESYAFTCGDYFSVGGTADDFGALVCGDDTVHSGNQFTSDPLTEDDMVEASSATKVFNKPIYKDTFDLMLKI